MAGGAKPDLAARVTNPHNTGRCSVRMSYKSGTCTHEQTHGLRKEGASGAAALIFHVSHFDRPGRHAGRTLD